MNNPVSVPATRRDFVMLDGGDLVPVDARVQEILTAQQARTAFLERRLTEMQAACNVELQKRRKFEAEANQQYAEYELVRAECMRQRDRAETLAGFIESLPIETGIPRAVASAIQEVFPEKQKGEKPCTTGADQQSRPDRGMTSPGRVTEEMRALSVDLSALQSSINETVHQIQMAIAEALKRGCRVTGLKEAK